MYNKIRKVSLKNLDFEELFREKNVYTYEYIKGGELYEEVFDIGYHFRVHNAARRV